MIALINDWVVAVRGADIQQLDIFSYVPVGERVLTDHPIRKLRVLVDTILQDLDEVLATRYAAVGRASIPPRAAACSRWSTACAANGC